LQINASIGEALDRYSIIIIKSKKITDLKKLSYINSECSYLYPLIKKKLNLVNDLFEQLMVVNLEMWDVNETRKKKIKNGDLDVEYINLSIKESVLNDRRFIIKSKINSFFDTDIREQKSYI